MEAFADADEDSDEILSDIAARVHFGPQFERAANAVSYTHLTLPTKRIV